MHLGGGVRAVVHGHDQLHGANRPRPAQEDSRGQSGGPGHGVPPVQVPRRVFVRGIVGRFLHVEAGENPGDGPRQVRDHGARIWGGLRPGEARWKGDGGEGGDVQRDADR